MGDGRIVFVVLAESAGQERHARLLVESLRTFGGTPGRSPVWLFLAGGVESSLAGPEDAGVRAVPLAVPEPMRGYPLSAKVYACARAEEMAVEGVDTIAWIDAHCLVVNPLPLLVLDPPLAAALRPVHIRNVGLPAGQAPDAYWSRIEEAAGTQDDSMTVESFVDEERLRGYYNTHCFSVDPQRGLLCRWRECFEELVRDRAFQEGPCCGTRHRIFLHQAVLSSLLRAALRQEHVRMLPSSYGYPYNLHGDVPADRKARCLEDLVCVVYEERSLHPSAAKDLAMGEPLRSWIGSHWPA